MTGKSAFDATISQALVGVLCCLLVAVPVAGVAGGQPTAAAAGHAPSATAGDGGGGSSLEAGLLVRQTNESSTDDTDAGTGNGTNGDESDGNTNRTKNETAGNGTAENETAESEAADEPALIESYTATTAGTTLTVRVESSERLRQIALAVYDMDGDEVADRESNFHVGTAYVTTFNLSNGTYRTSLVTARSYDRRVDDPTSHFALVTVPESGSNETDPAADGNETDTEPDGTDPADSDARDERAETGTETPGRNRTATSDSGSAETTTATTEQSTTLTPVPTTSASPEADIKTNRESQRMAGTTPPPETRATPADDPGSEPRPRTQGALLGSPFLQSVLTLVAAAVLALLSVVLWVRG